MVVASGEGKEGKRGEGEGLLFLVNFGELCDF
jgi:hypothetical protein